MKSAVIVVLSVHTKGAVILKPTSDTPGIVKCISSRYSYKPSHYSLLHFIIHLEIAELNEVLFHLIMQYHEMFQMHNPQYLYIKNCPELFQILLFTIIFESSISYWHHRLHTVSFVCNTSLWTYGHLYAFWIVCSHINNIGNNSLLNLNYRLQIFVFYVVAATQWEF